MADTDFAEKLFPQWIGSLAADVRTLASVVKRTDVPRKMRATLVGALNYLFRSLDIVPDWFPSLGFVDDAMVIRVGASLAAAVEAGDAHGDDLAAMYRLGNEAESVKELLGDELNEKLVAYVQGLPAAEVRGRTADGVLKDAEQMKLFQSEIATFAADYKTPAYEADERFPEKMRQFVSGKLGK